LFGAAATPAAVHLSCGERLAIVSVVSRVETLAEYCTGVLVAERLVLTAKHCRIGAEVEVQFGPDKARPYLVVSSLPAITHPTLDVMALPLPASDQLQQLALRPLPPIDRVLDSSWVGRSVQLGGFGLTESGSIGQLGFVTEALAGVEPDLLEVAPAAQSGGCEGDSGGPLIALDQAGQACTLGVLSQGDSSCTGRDQYVRVDTLAAWLSGLNRAGGGAADPAADGG
jgi:hypothetical protein